MAVLPVIVGYGGVNAAGRSSFDQAYRRMVLENLEQTERQRTLCGLACMMKLVSWDAGVYRDSSHTPLSMAKVAERFHAQITAGTLVRRIEPQHFDPDAAPWQKTLVAEPGSGALSFRAHSKDLPETLPSGWQVRELEDGQVGVSIDGPQEWRVPTTRNMLVKAAGQLPTGFEPANLYNARFQPRGLQLALFGASDAVRSVGIDWQQICAAVRPDETAVYASSAMGQLADEGLGGLMASRQLGQRPSSKQVPMGLTSMPADFVNAYVLGNLGHTESVAGACASFLYNLRAAVADLRRGACRVAVVGCSEAPVLPDVIEGYTNMSALATAEGMARLGDDDPRRYSRPFGRNAGFVIGEAAQYIILMDDALAIELGADIFGAVPDVFIDADGVKKSISGPGPGNYICFGKAVASARNILGERALRERSFVMAHGSSTPQNRTTESMIFDRIAAAFGIENWPICAVKAYVGHSLAPASGDQIMTAIGAMRYGLIPGIKTMDAVADDVHKSHLAIPLDDLHSDRDIAFINAKGFGGNNASAVLFSAAVAEGMLGRRYARGWSDYLRRRETTRAVAADYESRADRGELAPIYRFGEGMISDDDVAISADEICVPGYGKAVAFGTDNPYADMSDQDSAPPISSVAG